VGRFFRRCCGVMDFRFFNLSLLRLDELQHRLFAVIRA
jgi:hypothetical protein